MIPHIHAPNPLIAIGVLASTAATDAVCVMFNAAVLLDEPPLSFGRSCEVSVP